MQLSTKLSRQDRDIVDSVASGWYFTPDAPLSNLNKTAATISVGTATGQAQTSEAYCELPYLTCHQTYLDMSCLDSHIIFSELGIFVVNIAKSSSQKTRLLSMTATISRF